ncbi:hypothetical protein [Anaeromicropila populeti]|uniref:Uncharacterized protein n=1 Tax=Anaeromicropila populeti TaxID=37658 RepID=A0A1I6KLW9_9FIRM|nr:hypothetical protein [Anaeromicropila populeti]SFR92196.1 hypothetical protein SAMN05661086_02524 [Anaeromicropila populeti]
MSIIKEYYDGPTHIVIHDDYLIGKSESEINSIINEIKEIYTNVRFSKIENEKKW